EQVQSVLNLTAEQVQSALTATTDQVQTVLTSTTDQMHGALTASTGEMEAAIAATQERLQTALGKTTEQMESVLGKSTNLLEEALESTSQRVSTQLGSFTSTAGNESQRAADALRQTQATMILEMQQALEPDTQRFNETAAAMRETAKEVGTELEATRSELARGVMELPEETKSSAAAMRRVVAEQIEALAELNAIVRAQPATHDLNERPRAPERAERPAPAPAQPEPAPARQEPERAAPVATAPRPAATPSRPAAAPAGKSEEGGGGWLRDVLRNASASQP